MYKNIDEAIENATTFDAIAKELATFVRTYKSTDDEAIHEGADMIERALSYVLHKVANVKQA